MASYAGFASEKCHYTYINGIFHIYFTDTYNTVQLHEQSIKWIFYDLLNRLNSEASLEDTVSINNNDYYNISYKHELSIIKVLNYTATNDFNKKYTMSLPLKAFVHLCSECIENELNVLRLKTWYETGNFYG